MTIYSFINCLDLPPQLSSMYVYRLLILRIICNPLLLRPIFYFNSTPNDDPVFMIKVANLSGSLPGSLVSLRHSGH